MTQWALPWRALRSFSDYSDRKVIDRARLSGELDLHLNLSTSDLGHSSSDAIADVKLAREPSTIWLRYPAVTNPPLRISEPRRKSRQIPVSVLDIRRDFVSWSRDWFAAVAKRSCQVKNLQPPADFELTLFFWLVECDTNGVLAMARFHRFRRLS
jgi:hypothetical protein